jgi:hypothetical protein
MGQATKPVIPMSDDLERRSWLISEAYDVLQRMEAPPAEATDMAIFLALSQAFSNESLAVASRAPADADVGTHAHALGTADRRRRKAKSMESGTYLK